VVTQFAIDLGKRGGEISPLWFGHNLEHTRSCVWQGLSAQLVRNRKFAGHPCHDGAARHWRHVGPPGSWCLLEHAGGYKRTDGEAYTAHFDDRVQADRQRQRIEACRPGVACGLEQRGIPLVGGRAYEGRLALRADRELSVRVAVAGAARTQVSVGPGGWTEASFGFTAPTTDDDARLEIAFEGPGVVYVGAVSLLPADHFLGMRRDVVELLKEIGVPLLRWPGGNFAGDYRWKDGLLPVDRRAPLRGSDATLPHTDGFDGHEIGTDEFIALCRELGAEPFITINMSLEGPAEAAAWVEYCNGPADSEWGARRAERGHPEPYRVTHWTLGNEMGYGHMAGADTAADYNRLAAACARAMRQVDPSIVLTASTGWDAAWYAEVLNADEDYFDHISHHTYDSLLKSFVGDEGHREFRELVALPANVFHASGLVDGRQEGRRLTMCDIRSLIDARRPGRKPVGIAFDEWNVWYAWYRVPGVAEGIYAASMLNFFCRDARRLGMTLGAYFEPVNEGAILVWPEAARLTPVGQVSALFKPHHGRQLLEAEGARHDGELDLAASLDETRREIIVTLVNRSPDEGHEAEIALRGAAAVASADGVALVSDDFLPGSEFRQQPLEVRRTGGSTLSASLPPHSVARVRIALRH